jgi:hypothetical protein
MVASAAAPTLQQGSPSELDGASDKAIGIAQFGGDLADRNAATDPTSADRGPTGLARITAGDVDPLTAGDLSSVDAAIRMGAAQSMRVDADGPMEGAQAKTEQPRNASIPPDAPSPAPSILTATDATTIVDPLIHASVREYASKPNTGSAQRNAPEPIAPVSAPDVGAEAATAASTTDAVALPDWAAPDGADSRAPESDVSSDSPTTSASESSEAWERPTRISSDLDRRIQRVSDQWFASGPHSPAIELSHYESIMRGDLVVGGGDSAAERAPDAPDVSYARQWRRMRAGLNRLGADADRGAWEWERGSGAWSPNRLSGVGDDLDDNAFLNRRSGRSRNASLPMFAGLSDGFERL